MPAGCCMDGRAVMIIIIDRVNDKSFGGRKHSQGSLPRRSTFLHLQATPRLPSIGTAACEVPQPRGQGHRSRLQQPAQTSRTLTSPLLALLAHPCRITTSPPPRVPQRHCRGRQQENRHTASRRRFPRSGGRIGHSGCRPNSQDHLFQGNGSADRDQPKYRC
jgi:hypothetical protein